MDLPAVLDNWGAKLPPERVHVVTVPHDRGPTGNELWFRFCRAFGIDPEWAPLDSERANRSLGIAETQLVRRLNRRLELPMWRDATYDALIRELLAQDVLASRDSIPVRLPPDRFDFAETQAERLDRLDQAHRGRRRRRRGGPASASPPTRTSRGATPTGSAPSSSSAPRSTPSR